MIKKDFVAERIASSVEKFGEIYSEMKQKALNPDAGRNMNPWTARNADNDLYVLEGIRRINFGRGVIDPTPGGTGIQSVPQRPTNRLNRQVRRSSRATPKRIPRSPSTFSRYVASVGGETGRMASDISRYPRGRNFARVTRDEIDSAVFETKQKVDSVLGEQPKTLEKLLLNLKKLEMLTNGMMEDGSPIENKTDRNFSLFPLYFMAMLQPGLEKAVGGRFRGKDTVPSLFDLGIYYSLASDIIDNPEAFRNVDLYVEPANMPDSSQTPGFEGAVATFPSYYSLKARRPGDNRRVSAYGLSGVVEPSSVTSPYGVKEYTNLVRWKLNPKLVGGKIPILMKLMTENTGQERKATFRGVEANRDRKVNEPWMPRVEPVFFSEEARPSKLTQVQNLLDEYMDYLESSDGPDGQSRPPFIETTVAAVTVSALEEASQIFAKAEEVLSENPSVTPGMIEAMKKEAYDLLDKAEMLAAITLAKHEMGHVLDAIGDYKNSPAYEQATDTAGRGLNTNYEYSRDMAVLESLQNMEPSPYLDDVAEELARNLMRQVLKTILTDYMVYSNASSVLAKINENLSSLSAVRSKTDDFMNHDRKLLDGVLLWMRDMAAGRIKTTQDALQWPTRSGLIRLSPDMDPVAVNEKIEALTKEIAEMFPRFDNFGWHPQVREALSAARFMLKDQNFSDLSDQASVQGKVFLSAARLFGLLSYLDETLQRAKKILEETIKSGKPKREDFTPEGEAMSLSDPSMEMMPMTRYSYLVPWINEQTIDMNGVENGWRSLMSQIISGNPSAVEEFMEIYGKNEREDSWMDEEARFSKAGYVASELRPINSQGKIGVPRLAVLTAINNAVNKRGSSGWKDLTDEEALIMSEAMEGITDYAGQTDYSLSSPIPRNIQTSNAETYAELHAAIATGMESILDKLTQPERDVAKKLHDQMIQRVNRMTAALLRNAKS